MNTGIIKAIVTILLLLGSGYAAPTIFSKIEKMALTRIAKGLSSSERFAEKLTGKKLDF